MNEELKTVSSLASTFTFLLKERRSIDAQLDTVSPALVTLLQKYDYVPRNGYLKGEVLEDAYALHPDYVASFDGGLYDEATQMWKPMDEVPPDWALVRLEP